MDAPFCQSVAWEHSTFSFISNFISYPPSYNRIPILAWFKDSYFTFDGFSTIQVFPLLFNHGNGKITLADWWNGNCNFSSSCTQRLPYKTNPCFHSCEGPHCKDKMPKIWNKYSQDRNIGVSVLISTFMCLWANYIFPRWVFLFCWRKYVVDRSWEYINRSQTHECGNWGWGRAIPRKGIHKRNCRSSAN